MVDALLLLTQFNVDSPLPNLFSLVASRYLTKLLGDLFKISHRSLSSRYTNLVPTLEYSSEIYLLLSLVTEGAFLRKLNSGFVESFFGLTRASLNVGMQTSPAALGTTVASFPLSPAQRVISLFQLVISPYMLDKLHSQYSHYTSDQPDTIEERRHALRSSSPLKRRWLRLYISILIVLYPVISMLVKAIRLAMLLGYATEKSCYCSALNLLSHVGIIKSAPSGSRSKFTTAASLFLAGTFVVLRYWDWSSGNVGTQAPGTKTVNVKPPQDRSYIRPGDGSCQVCNKPLVNPAVNIVSGSVCCYVCLQEFVSEYHRCPVTRQRCTTDHIRRLYE